MGAGCPGIRGNSRFNRGLRELRQSMRRLAMLMAAQHIFHFASVAKPFVATALVQQCCRTGKIRAICSKSENDVEHLHEFCSGGRCRYRDFAVFVTLALQQQFTFWNTTGTLEDYEWPRSAMLKKSADSQDTLVINFVRAALVISRVSEASWQYGNLGPYRCAWRSWVSNGFGQQFSSE